jgi:TonB family protein
MRIVLTLVFVLIFSGLAIAQDKPRPSSSDPPSQTTAPPASPVYRVGGDVKPPHLLDTPSPELTEDEKKQGRETKYKGVARLTIVVGEDGSVCSAQVTRSLGTYLDGKAIEKVKTWKFEPATRQGKPVAVQLAVEVNFRLH